MSHTPAPIIADWYQAQRWVYSITFDEALADLYRFVVPILEAASVPGHVEVVVGQLGEVRAIGNSSYNGFRHMNARELRDLLSRGWGVGNHTWTHTTVNAQTAPLELNKARSVLEEAIGEPVTVYCSSGDNTNMNDEAIAACRRLGYLAAMSLTDALNRPDDADLLWLNRTFLHTQGYGPFFSEFDPWRNIQHAKHDRGWIIDYCHCPLEKAVHPNKDCSADELRRRIEAIRTEGGDEVWLARVEHAVDYRYTRRAAVIREQSPGVFDVEAVGLHPAVSRRILSLILPTETRGVTVDGMDAKTYRVGSELVTDVDLSSPRVLRLL